MVEAVLYPGRAEAGRFIPDSPGAFKFAFRPFEGKAVEVLVREFKKTRSNRQNRAWFGIVIKAFMDYMGERDKLYVHTKVLEAIGHYEVKMVFGKEDKKVLPTHNLKADKFKALYEAAQELGAQYGVMIPDPDSGQGKALMEGQ